MKLQIYSKKDCHLCVEAKAVLLEFARRYPLEIEEIDIEKDADAFAKYQHEIPVVFLGERKLFKYRIDERKLEKVLRGV